MDGEPLRVIADMNVNSLKVSEKTEEALVSIARSFQSIAETVHSIRSPLKTFIYCAGFSLAAVSSALVLKTIFRFYRFSCGKNGKNNDSPAEV